MGPSLAQDRHRDCHRRGLAAGTVLVSPLSLLHGTSEGSVSLPGAEAWQKQGQKPSLGHQTFNHNPLLSPLNELCQDRTNLAAGIFCLPLLEAGNGHGMRSYHQTVLRQTAPRTSEHTWPDGCCVFATKPAPSVPKRSAGGISFQPSPELGGISRCRAVPEGAP